MKINNLLIYALLAAGLCGCGGSSQSLDTSAAPQSVQRMLSGGAQRSAQADAQPNATASIAGYRDNFTIVKDQTTNVVTITSKTDSSVTTYQNPSLIKFFDKWTSFDIDGAAGQVYRLYQAAFNRKPDLPGLGFWIAANGNGRDLLGIASDFVVSAEFKTLYGDSPANLKLINAFYNNVLHRDGEKDGVDWWTAQMNNGAPANGVLYGFSDSAENKNNLQAGMQNGFDYAPFNQGGPIIPKRSSYENKAVAANSIGSQQLPSEVAGGSAAAFADFFQEGAYSLVTHTLDYFVNGVIDPARYGSIHFYKRDGTGRWIDNTASLLKDTKGCIHPRKAVVGDFNDDGKPDVFFACHGVDAPPYAGEHPHVLMSQADGTYKNVTLPITCFCHAAATIDSKSTGYADILVTDNSVQLTPFFLKNNRDGTFAVDKTRLPDFTKRAIASVELVDFGTGKYDVWFGGEDSGPNAVNVRNTMIVQNDGNDSFVGTKIMPLPASIDYGFPLDMVVNGGKMYLLRTNIEGGPANYGKNYYTTAAVQRIDIATLTSSIIYRHTGEYANGMFWVNWIIPTGSSISSMDSVYGINVQ